MQIREGVSTGKCNATFLATLCSRKPACQTWLVVPIGAVTASADSESMPRNGGLSPMHAPPPVGNTEGDALAAAANANTALVAYIALATQNANSICAKAQHASAFPVPEDGHAVRRSIVRNPSHAQIPAPRSLSPSHPSQTSKHLALTKSQAQ
jgi:hypothetical protein